MVAEWMKRRLVGSLVRGVDSGSFSLHVRL